MTVERGQTSGTKVLGIHLHLSKLRIILSKETLKDIKSLLPPTTNSF
jgi:hypothetical protein